MNNIRLLKENFSRSIGEFIYEADTGKFASEKAKMFMKGISDKVTLDGFSKNIKDLSILGAPSNIYTAIVLNQIKYNFIPGVNSIDNFDTQLLDEIGKMCMNLYNLQSSGEKEEANSFLKKYMGEDASKAADLELKGMQVDDKTKKEAEHIISLSLHDNNGYFEKKYNEYKNSFEKIPAFDLALLSLINKLDATKLKNIVNFTDFGKYLVACRILFADRNKQFSF